MNIGFTFDEKCLNTISAEEIIHKSAEANVKSIEISPDTDILSEKVYKSIIKIASDFSFEINYHIPYFANDIYDLNNFIAYKSISKQKYEAFLSLINSLQEFINNEPIIIVHGAKYNNKIQRKDAIYATESFIDWILNILESKKLPYKIVLETLSKKDERNICDERENLLYFLERFRTNKLGICWDICHDTLNFHPEEVPLDNNFIEKVNYCHIHGTDLDNRLSHISLVKSQIDYELQLKKLIETQYAGILNIELLVNNCKDSYIEDLFNDINYLNEIIY